MAQICRPACLCVSPAIRDCGSLWEIQIRCLTEDSWIWRCLVGIYTRFGVCLFGYVYVYYIFVYVFGGKCVFQLFMYGCMYVKI